MRYLLVALALAGCYAASEEPPPRDVLSDTQRPLVTDQLPYHLERDKVRAWHDNNDWCRRRTWPSTDEFVICNHHPYMNNGTPPMYALVRYDADNRTIAYATFTPVPCRLYGRCDAIFARTVYPAEHDFVDHEAGLRDHVADRGRAVEPSDVEMPAMQQRMFDALADELHRRFGNPVWQDPHRFGATWLTPSSEIGLFVGGRGGWVVETHEMRTSS